LGYEQSEWLIMKRGNAVIAQGSSKLATVLVVKVGFSVLARDSLTEACPSLYSVKSLLVLTAAGLEHAEALNSSDVMTNDNSNGVFVDFS